jgi:toxin ParE1/3/4
MGDFRLDSQASEDVSHIFGYIATDNLRAAEKWRDELIELLLLLARNPLMGERCPELAKDLCNISLGNYVIYFRPHHQHVQIVRVVHGARDVKRIFRKPKD